MVGHPELTQSPVVHKRRIAGQASIPHQPFLHFSFKFQPARALSPIAVLQMLARFVFGQLPLLKTGMKKVQDKSF